MAHPTRIETAYDAVELNRATWGNPAQVIQTVLFLIGLEAAKNNSHIDLGVDDYKNLTLFSDDENWIRDKVLDELTSRDRGFQARVVCDNEKGTFTRISW